MKEDKKNVLINRVANSGIITLNLEEYFPSKEVLQLDLRPMLFKELILKEKDFRASLKEIDWTQYEDKILCTYCSSDAIIPVWAYMLVSALSSPFAEKVYYGTPDEFYNSEINSAIDKVDFSIYEGKRIVIKGCSNKPVPPGSYLHLTSKLQPYAQSIMYGEPCSTVPIFKRPRKLQKN
jgi:hypothetical protein